MIVKYRRLYPYAPYLNEEIGYEKSIPDDSTDEQMIDAALHLKSVADKSHEKANPGISVNQTPEPYNQPPAVVNIAAEKTEIAIDNATTVDHLLAVAEDAEKYQLKGMWNIKLAALTAGKPIKQ